MNKIVLLPQAVTDYEEALAWYWEQSPRTTDRFETTVADVLERLAKSPLERPLIDDRHRFWYLRRFPFSIVYRCEEDAIAVVAFAHSSRNSSFWKER